MHVWVKVEWNRERKWSEKVEREGGVVKWREKIQRENEVKLKFRVRKLKESRKREVEWQWVGKRGEKIEWKSGI